jgi:hypothetical protein
MEIPDYDLKEKVRGELWNTWIINVSRESLLKPSSGSDPTRGSTCKTP